MNEDQSLSFDAGKFLFQVDQSKYLNVLFTQIFLVTEDTQFTQGTQSVEIVKGRKANRFIHKDLSVYFTHMSTGHCVFLKTTVKLFTLIPVLILSAMLEKKKRWYMVPI